MVDDLEMWGFLLYSTTKLAKPGNHMNNFYVVIYAAFYIKSLGLLYPLVFEYIFTIFYASLELPCFWFKLAL